MEEYKCFLFVLQLFCYGIFTYSGLAHLICSFTTSTCAAVEFLIPSWATSVYALLIAHFSHAAYTLGWKFATFFFALSFVVVCVMEELSLRYDGVIFGRYSFTAAMGVRITPNMPLLVPVCWIALIYPTFLMSNLVLRDHPLSMPRARPHDVLLSGLAAAVMLTAFDLVSEPVHTLYGHNIWHHAAFVDSRTPLQSYRGEGDWSFESGQYMNGYFGIPIQNFAGWMLCGFVLYSFAFTVAASAPSTTPVRDSKSWASIFHSWTAPLALPIYDSNSEKLKHFVFLMNPISLGLLCTQLFLVFHPCHHGGVRLAGWYYMLSAGSLLLESFKTMWR